MSERINSTGAWVRNKLSHHIKTVDKLLRLRMDDASFLLNAGVKPVHLSRVKPETVWRLTERARTFGVTPWWMTFPHSNDPDLDEYLLDLAKMLKGVPDEARPEGIELDAENKYDSIGWGPSGTRLAPAIIKGLQDLGFDKVFITCVIFRSGFRRQDMALIEAAKAAGMWVGLAPQLYSKDDPNKSWDDGELFRPGIMQSFGMDWCNPLVERGLLDELRVGGMTAYQNHPAPWPDDREALEQAHDTAFERGARAWRYWALDQVGTRDGDEIFLQEAPFREDEAPYRFEGEEPDQSRKQKVRELQGELKANGYLAGKVDGLAGRKTKAAVAEYRKSLRYVPAPWCLPRVDALVEELDL